ncbi:hypothetical protein DIS24_g4635 [Lasiodiplodia hormozganensis]|uniref:Uncharacterized protein n=1 Tax=Lasiodiplodia hormozganensis TaxID=869390 RepID=A0AA39YU49_9PEZI|nr:hypothetical protein DIS24_g4635 [Lasiodiplodia hormozganensis]
MPPRPDVTLYADEAATMPPDKHKGVIAKFAHKMGEFLALLDDRMRFAKIGRDIAQPIWRRDAAYFAGRDEVVLRSDTATRRRTKAGAVVLIGPKMAARFQELNLVEPVRDPFEIQVKTSYKGIWDMTVSGTMSATVFFTDKRFFKHKEIFVDNTAKNNVECWILDGSNADHFPFPMYFTFDFVDQEKLESPPTRALQLNRNGVHPAPIRHPKGVRLVPSPRFSDHAQASAMRKSGDDAAAAQAAEQHEQERLNRERFRKRS